MQQEFIISRGKAVIERDILYINHIKADPVFSFNIFQIMLLCAWLLSEVTGLNDGVLSLPAGIVGTILCLNTFNIVPLYKFLFKKCLSNRIPLHRIISYEIKEDYFGLENEVILHLQSGRYKSIAFRKLEKEDERFLEIISQNIAQLQLA
ncbi:MAG TPA: hypothetical protein VIQ00_00540 [Chitinophagaceae bacterium]|jgi:hypothetical protein